MIKVIIDAIVGGVLKAIVEYFTVARRDQKLEELGWEKGAAHTLDALGEMSDEQARIAAQSGGTADDVLRRLRDRRANKAGADRKP